MEDIAEGARRVLNYIENNESEDRYIAGYICAAIRTQRPTGRRPGDYKVLEALTKINADTERLNQRIDTIENTKSILSTIVYTSAANSAAAWRDFRAGDWQRGLAKAARAPKGINECELLSIAVVKAYGRTSEGHLNRRGSHF